MSPQPEQIQALVLPSLTGYLLAIISMNLFGLFVSGYCLDVELNKLLI